MNIRPIINVTCAIIIKNNRVLAAQRSEKMSLPLKWEFPGGKIDTDESAEDCIQREIKEELNISIQIIQRLKDYSHNYENVTINLIPFIVEYIGGAITLAEHKTAIWFDKKDLFALDWAAADIPILHDFIKNKDA